MDFDIIVIGGGLAGSTFARSIALSGARVLVAERETVFKDRIRGEALLCWGVREARELGIDNLLMQTCAREIRNFALHNDDSPPAPPRDLVETSPFRAGIMTFPHPVMQGILLDAAESAGAVVRRGVTVTGISPGDPASVTYRESRGEETCRAPLVVGADGRRSRCRPWGGFRVSHDTDRMVIAGVLLEGLSAPDDTIHLFNDTSNGRFVITIPLNDGRFRSYAGFYNRGDRPLLGGSSQFHDFINLSVDVGAPMDWYQSVEACGPLASFHGADTWVENPYRDGIALIGDAAASSDPTFGCGLALTLRDVRVLRDSVFAAADPRLGAEIYSREHDRYYGNLHRMLDWMTTLFYDPNPEASLIRRTAFPKIAEDPTRIPDLVGVGPEAPSDAAARERFFGEA